MVRTSQIIISTVSEISFAFVGFADALDTTMSSFYNRRMTWLLCGVCVTLLTQTSNGEPLNRLKHNSAEASEKAHKEEPDIKSVEPTTAPPPSVIGLLVAPPTIITQQENSQELSGATSHEEKSSGASSRESLISGVGLQERSSEETSRGAPTVSSGASSREHISGGGSSESLSSLSRVGSREEMTGQSPGNVGSMQNIVSIYRVGLRPSKESSFAHSGTGSKEPGARSKVSGERLNENNAIPSGAGSQESGAGSKGSGMSSKESGVGSREDGHLLDSSSPNRLVVPETRSSFQDLTTGFGVVLSQEVSSGLSAEPEVVGQYSQEEFDSLTAPPDDTTGPPATTHGVRRSREAHGEVPSVERNTLVTSLEEEKPLNVEAIVRTLQSQLLESQTSQARTRSILNTLQERQGAQDRDLASLKAELSLVRSRQERDHTQLDVVRGMVSDTAWAVKDLKANIDQLHVDFSAFKQNQQRQNDTMLVLEDNLGEAQHHQYDYTELVKRLHHDVNHLKTSLLTDRDTMSRLKHMLSSLDWARHQMASRHDHINNIPLVPGGSGEGSSGGNENSNNIRSDNIVSTIEETDNTIGHNIVELYKHKHHMHMQIENVNKRFLQYDVEMSRVYAMYYNLSLQISALENKMLTRQQQSFDTDMATLQRSFLNFTQQVFNAEQLHMTTKAQLNATTQNEHRIHRLSSSVDNHQMRIRTLENLLVDYRSTNTDFRRMLDAHLGVMNESVVSVRGRLKDHKSKAILNFGEVEERLADLRTEVKRHNRRIIQVEVRSLNESLIQCKKVNEDMIQDMKIDQVRSDMRRLDAQVSDHTGQINRHDRSIGMVYKEAQGNNRMIGEVMTQTKVLFDLAPRTLIVEEEVNKLLMHLPPDCAELLAENEYRAGLYLIKPVQSVRSVRVYCDTDQSGAWLIVQRRESGTESFARSWDEYAAGFGSPDKEFWIGNDILHYVTSQNQYRLHIDMWDLDDVYYFVQYDYFRVEDADTNYRLSIDGYHGNATDALRYSNYMPFSTMDRDHDVSSTHCAKFYTSGWWYKHCHYSNLNGRYTVGVVWFNHDFDEWIQMKRSVMKIQAVNGTISTSGR